MHAHILVTLRRLSTDARGRCEVSIKMFDSNGVEYFTLDQYFHTQMEALQFINKINNSRQHMEIVL